VITIINNRLETANRNLLSICLLFTGNRKVAGSPK